MRYEIIVNQEKNRLILVAEGFFNVEQAQEAIDAIKTAVMQLQPGFDYITDNRTFKAGSPKVAELIAELNNFIIKYGVNRMIGIASENVIGQMQLERVSNQVGANFVAAPSIEAAEALLDNE
jgi:hypothetical protein